MAASDWYTLVVIPRIPSMIAGFPGKPTGTLCGWETPWLNVKRQLGGHSSSLSAKPAVNNGYPAAMVAINVHAINMCFLGRLESPWCQTARTYVPAVWRVPRAKEIFKKFEQEACFETAGRAALVNSDEEYLLPWINFRG